MFLKPGMTREKLMERRSNVYRDELRRFRKLTPEATALLAHAAEKKAGFDDPLPENASLDDAIEKMLGRLAIIGLLELRTRMELEQAEVSN